MRWSKQQLCGSAILLANVTADRGHTTVSNLRNFAPSESSTCAV